MLATRDLSTSYGGLIALSNATIDVQQGEIVCVAGANGAGKSTLLKSIVGMERPSSGTVEFLGERIDGLAPHLVTQRGIAYVPENRRLFPRLGERLPQRAETLSGGEQQMLAIGRALMTRPKLLMLDEPSQGIMPKLVDEIFVAVSKIRAAGTTVLIVEQRLTECLEIADRAYVLQTGRVTMSGTAAEIAGNAEVRKAYLGL